MKKLFCIVIGAILLLPVVVNAADFTVKLSCPTNVDAGKEFTCTVTATGASITAFQGTVDLTGASGIQLASGTENVTFIGSTGTISLKSTSNATGAQKIKLTNIKDSNGLTADAVETSLTVGTATTSVKDNPDTAIDGSLLLVIVLATAGISGYYVFNKNSKFTSI